MLHHLLHDPIPDFRPSMGWLPSLVELVFMQRALRRVYCWRRYYYVEQDMRSYRQSNHGGEGFLQCYRRREFDPLQRSISWRPHWTKWRILQVSGLNYYWYHYIKKIFYSFWIWVSGLMLENDNTTNCTPPPKYFIPISIGDSYQKH